MGNNGSKLENGLGRIGTSIGDLFYPSNVKLRARAQQLEEDCKDLASRFEELKKELSATLSVPVQFLRLGESIENFLTDGHDI